MLADWDPMIQKALTFLPEAQALEDNAHKVLAQKAEARDTAPGTAAASTAVNALRTRHDKRASWRRMPFAFVKRHANVVLVTADRAGTLLGFETEWGERSECQEVLPSKRKTIKNLLAAFEGESNAHAKYVAFAAKADADGLHGAASLLRAAGRAEQIHAANHARVIKQLGGEAKCEIHPVEIKTTLENLKAALAGETVRSRDSCTRSF